MKNLAQLSGSWKVSQKADFRHLSPKGRQIPESLSSRKSCDPSPKLFYVGVASSKMEFPIAWEEIHNLSQHIKMLHPAFTCLDFLPRLLGALKLTGFLLQSWAPTLRTTWQRTGQETPRRSLSPLANKDFIFVYLACSHGAGEPEWSSLGKEQQLLSDQNCLLKVICWRQNGALTITLVLTFG